MIDVYGSVDDFILDGLGISQPEIDQLCDDLLFRSE